METQTEEKTFKVIVEFMQTETLVVKGSATREFLSKDEAYATLKTLEEVLHAGRVFNHIILYHPETDCKEAFKFVNSSFIEKSVISCAIVNFKN